jgi:ribonuclease HI
MPWMVALLRGQKVLARARGAEGGRVEIRYKKTDSRAYRAGIANLQIVRDEPVVPDAEVVPGEDPKGGAPRPVRGPAPARLETKSSAAATRSADGWIAFTDGACSGNPGPAGSGVVVIRPGGRIDEGFEYLGTSTNNVAELTGILRALEAIPEGAPSILIHTDSQYSIGVLSKGWKPKVNQELIARTKAFLARRPQARLVYVKGHAGIPMNERADELAREAVRLRRTKPIRVE